LWDATSVKLSAEAEAMLAGTHPGGDIRALQELVAARKLTEKLDEGALYSAVVRTTSMRKIIQTPKRIFAVTFSPDGERVASVSPDNGDVVVWNAKNGELIACPSSNEAGLSAVAFSQDRIAACGKNGHVLLWDTKTWKSVSAPQTGHEGQVNAVAFSPNGHLLASAAHDGTIRLWNADTAQPIGQSWKGHTESVNAVAFSPDGHHLVSGGSDATVRLWDIDTSPPIGGELTGEDQWVGAVAFSLNGERIAAGDGDGKIRQWNAANRMPIGKPLDVNDTDPVWSVSSDSHRIVSGAPDGLVRLWNADTGQPIGQPFAGHQGWVTGVSYSPIGDSIVSGGADGTIRFWDPRTQESLIPQNGKLKGAFFSADQSRVATLGEDHSLRVWNTSTGQPIGTPLVDQQQSQPPNGAPVVNGLSVSPDGRRVAAGMDDGSFRIWDADTARLLAQGVAVSGKKLDVEFSPNGKRIATVSKPTASEDAVIGLWDADTGAPIKNPLAGLPNKIYAIAFSPTGDRIAAAAGPRVWVLDASTGGQIGNPLKGYKGPVIAVAFSPNGQRIATAGSDATIRLWDANSYRSVGKPLTGHRNMVSRVAFSGDSRRLISGDDDGSLRLWKADTREPEPIGNPLPGQAPISSAVFSPDGNRIISAHADGTVRAWPAVAAEADLCNKLTLNMSDKQWSDWVSPSIPYKEACPQLPKATDDQQPLSAAKPN
jgi:WD40 repeat protein